ncbi:MAG: NAD(P)-binding protein [Propionibacteriales bacterium]|nr:NAD(P)-binding protein [Propionibacteriales bacterium]
MSAGTHDAVVVGAGPNGLVAANRLLDAGWSVVVLEAQEELGGAVRSDSAVHPDFVHDTFSAFYPLAATSPAIQAFRLEDHGLRWRHAPAVLGHPRPDRSWAILHRDRYVTASLMDEQCAGDGQAWLDTCAEWDRIGDHLVGALLSPFPPVRAGLGALSKLRSVGGLGFIQSLLSPAVELGRSRFGGEIPRLLLAGNAGHSDIPLDSAGSGLMGLLLCMLGQTVGYPVPEGGAGQLTQALARRIRSLGGEIRCSTRVDRVVVGRGRATGVVTAAGEPIEAGRAVIADVVAPHLYGGLVRAEDLPARTMKAMRHFQLDPSTVKVDWALNGPVPWASPPSHAAGTVHVADSVNQMTEALSQVAAHAVPAEPFLLCGQMTTSDPTRSPAGTEALWAYTHVPQSVERDAGDATIRGDWDRDDCERFADRMQARLEKLAPGFTNRVLARRVLGPREMEAMDANLLGGAINGGTSQIHQELIFRPIPGTARAETPIRDLYLGSASAHPGGGVHGAPGMNAAKAAIIHARLQRLTPWR